MSKSIFFSTGWKCTKCMHNIFSTMIMFFIVFSLYGEMLGQSTGLSVVKLNDLSFGDVFIGYTADVSYTDGNAAKFIMQHNMNGNRKVLISFTLPAVLSSGSGSIPVTFDQLHTAFSFTDTPSGAQNFNPFTPLNTRFKKKESLYIWLGGAINTTVGASPGQYSGTIIITIELN